MEATAVREIHEAMLLNEASRELSAIVEPLRVQGEPVARSLVSHADSLSGEARTKIFRLLQKHPDKHPVVISLLRRVLELLEEDRRSPNLTAEQKSDVESSRVTGGRLDRPSLPARFINCSYSTRPSRPFHWQRPIEFDISSLDSLHEGLHIVWAMDHPMTEFTDSNCVFRLIGHMMVYEAATSTAAAQRTTRAFFLHDAMLPLR